GAGTMTESKRVSDEVTRLHDFFTAWYAGEPGRMIDEFSRSLDKGFWIVGPGGDVTGYDEIVAAVAAGHGESGMRIAVENFQVVQLGSAVVCRYDEVQTTAQERRRRISTAVMVTDTDTPGGYRWISVHETWVNP
ncbi:MAG: DUF4440 domain-containing protein, partial [Actinomycetota bacterium]